MARVAGLPDLLAEAALVLEPVPDPTTNAVVTALCEEALAAVTADAACGRVCWHSAASSRSTPVTRELTDAASVAALELARAAGDDRSLVAALRARHDAVPGPERRRERLALAAEMLVRPTAPATPARDVGPAVADRRARGGGRLDRRRDELGSLAAASSASGAR